MGVIVGSILGGICALLLLAAFLLWRRRASRRAPEDSAAYPWRSSFIGPSNAQLEGTPLTKRTQHKTQPRGILDDDVFAPLPSIGTGIAVQGDGIVKTLIPAGSSRRTQSIAHPSALPSSLRNASEHMPGDAPTDVTEPPSSRIPTSTATSDQILVDVDDTQVSGAPGTPIGQPGHDRTTNVGQSHRTNARYHEVDLDHIIELVARRIDPGFEGRSDVPSYLTGPPPRYPS